MTDEPSGPKLAAELAGLRARLAEAENVLSAIRDGEVDALVVTGERGEHVYTLHGAYRQLSETMSEGVVTLSASGVILYCNARLAEMLGRPLAEVLGTALRNYLPPADQQALDAILAQARTKSSRSEINLKSSEGRLVPVHLSASRLPGEATEIVFCLVLTDLTGQKRHEQMVADERLARLILEQAAEAIVVCDEQGRVIRANRAAQQFCDGSPLLQPFAEVFPLRTDASDPFQLAPVLQKETLRNVDVALDRQGQKFDLILNAGPLLSGQQVLGCVVNLTDITRRKGAEEAIRQSEERFRLIMESLKDLVAVLDLDGYRLYNNASYRDILGDPDSLRGSSSFDEIHPEDRERVRTVFRETVRTGVGQRLEYRLVDRAGQTHHIESQGSVIRDDQGRVAKVLVVSRDVTERKRMEVALRQREEYFRALTERASDVTTVLNADGTIRYQSPAVEQVFGHKPDELVGRSVFDLIHPGDLARAQQALAELVATPGSTTRIELRLRHNDGYWRVLEASTRNLLDDSNVKGIVINARDITERKQLEEALRESSQFNQQIVASAREGIVVYGRDLRYQVWNPFMEQLTGLSADQVLGKHPDEVFPFLRETGLLASIEKVLAGEPSSSIEVHVRDMPAGISDWTSQTNAPLRNAAGQIVGAIGIVRDMTEHKRTELRIAAFAHLGQRLNTARTAKEAGEIIVEVADTLLGWDACLFDLYSAAENRISHVLNMDLVDGRRTECKRQYLDSSPRELSRLAIEQGGQLILRDHPEAMRPEGSRFGDMSRPSASILFVPIRHVTEVVGVLSIQSYTPRAYDASSLETLQALADHAGGALERLRAEAALGESEATFRSVWERSIDGMRLTDKEGRIVAVNDAFCQLVKLPREKLEGQVFSVVYKGHGPNDGIEVYHKRFATGDIVPRLSARAQLWNGEEPDLEISTSFLELGQRGKMVLSIFRDVSERKRAELRVEASSQLGRRLSAARSPAEAARAIFASADQFWKWDSGVLDLQVPESRQMETALAYDVVDGQRREVLTPDPVGAPSAMSRRVMAQGAELILRKLDEPPATDTIRFGDASRLSASLMCVPMRVENRAVGVLSIQSYTPDAYTQEDLRTLQALADHCGGALDRLRMEELLRGSEVRYRRLFEAAKDGVLILDAETGMVVDVNPFLMQLLGLSKEAFLGKKIWELGFFKDIVANYDRFKELQEEEYIRYDDKPLKTADGRRIDVEFVSNVYQVNHHSVIQCNIRDITARKRTEWLGLIYRDQLRALSARIENLREEERMRISREIHDELGQMLTGIKMDLRWMEHRLDEFGEDRRVNPILDKLVATAELTDATVKAVQRIAAELRPGILDNLGLPTALQYEAAQFEARTGIACRLVVPGDELTLRPEVATAFFRIFQEALTNVTRHAKATAVEAELQLEADGCRLEVRDNGLGMAGVELTNLKSLGLLGMQERTSLLGGGVSFAPRPGGGTVVTIRIPNSPTSKGGV